MSVPTSPALGIVDANLESVRGAHAARVGARLMTTSWLSDRLVLMIFQVTSFGEQEPTITISDASSGCPLRTQEHRYPLSESPRTEGRMLLAVLPNGVASAPSRVSIEIRSWRRYVELDVEHVQDRTVGLRTLLRNELADLPSADRSAILALVTRASEWIAKDDGARAAASSLRILRDGLREPLPGLEGAPGRERCMAVDQLMAVSDRSFWIKGWLRVRDGRASRLTVVSPEGMTAELLDGASRHERPDLPRDESTGDSPGFVSYFELAAPSRLEEGWLCEVHGERGALLEVEGPTLLKEPLEVRNRILSEVSRSGEDSDYLLRNHVHPAVRRLQAQAEQACGVRRVRAYGEQVRSPMAAVVVPLFRRLDFVEHQFAQFVHDPEMREVELIYVLDSPEVEDRLHQLASDLHGVYGVPFRTVTLDTNAGIAGAMNRAAELVRAPRLVRLDSDALPRRPGWIGALARALSERGAGAVGSKLLYPDGTVQSCGLEVRFDADGTLDVRHRLAGMHARFGPATRRAPVFAVSGAGLMVERDRLLAMGGFHSGYVQGGFEDLDLCAGIAEECASVWIEPASELVHFEAQSFPGPLRELVTPYNRWLFADRRGATAREWSTPNYQCSGEEAS